MKTKLFYIVLSALLSFSTLNVFAGSSKGKKESSKKRNTSVSNIFSHVKVAEMEMETWMTSHKELNNYSDISNAKHFEIEGWMLNNCDESKAAVDFQEDELMLKSCMTNDLNSNINTENFKDTELIIEGWMLESFDAKTQEIFTSEELQLEAWMF